MRKSNRSVAPGLPACLLACVLSACAVRTVVDAPGSDALPQRRVSYAGLNLDSAAGARMLLRRLEAAAEQVCERPDQRDLAQQQRFHACYAQALADAVRQVNHRQLTVLYQASTGSAMSR